MYKDYDLLFDYKGKTLTLIDPDYTETFLKERKYEYEEVPFEMSKSMRDEQGDAPYSPHQWPD